MPETLKYWREFLLDASLVGDYLLFVRKENLIKDDAYK
jgi:hypothetical protein